MTKPTRFFNAVTNGSTLTLDMYDVIGADFFGDGITEGMVSDALKNSNASSVTVNINSPGGDAFAGVAIRNVLVQSGKTVKVNVVGLAASAASIIAMAGDTITMHSGSVMMIHPAQALAMGDATEMRKMADTLDTVTQSIADVYCAKTGMGKDDVLDLMNAETWMTADEAVDKGFATTVSKEKKAIANSYDLKAFRNAPAELQPVEEPTGEPVAEAIEVTEPDNVADATYLARLRFEINKRK